MKKPSRIAPAVIALGFVSLFTDLSSEMIYPLLPLFLTGVLGAGVMALGMIEGVAESTAAILKIVSGVWTDRTRRRKPFIVWGYGLSSLVRPLIGLASAWPGVLLLRFFDRVGKGIRSSPRDALIADVTPEESRGRAYGFHRAMDHTGAVIGPLVAAALLSIEGVGLRQIFLLAAIPGVIVAAILLFGVHEPSRPADLEKSQKRPMLAEALNPKFRQVLIALAVFTLGNSTDVFLLLRLSEAGLSASGIALLWSFHHVVKLVSNYFGGSLSDRVGRRPVILAGWALYAVVYLMFAFVSSLSGLIAVFLVYGLYFGLTEPGERALVTDLVPARLRGSAFGLYHMVIGITALPASALFGLIWAYGGASAAFTTGAILAAIASLLLLRTRLE